MTTNFSSLHFTSTLPLLWYEFRIYLRITNYRRKIKIKSVFSLKTFVLAKTWKTGILCVHSQQKNHSLLWSMESVVCGVVDEKGCVCVRALCSFVPFGVWDSNSQGIGEYLNPKQIWLSFVEQIFHKINGK